MNGKIVTMGALIFGTVFAAWTTAAEQAQPRRGAKDSGRKASHQQARD